MSNRLLIAIYSVLWLAAMFIILTVHVTESEPTLNSWFYLHVVVICLLAILLIVPYAAGFNFLEKKALDKLKTGLGCINFSLLLILGAMLSMARSTAFIDKGPVIGVWLLAVFHLFVLLAGNSDFSRQLTKKSFKEDKKTLLYNFERLLLLAIIFAIFIILLTVAIH